MYMGNRTVKGSITKNSYWPNSRNRSLVYISNFEHYKSLVYISNFEHYKTVAQQAFKLKCTHHFSSHCTWMPLNV